MLASVLVALATMVSCLPSSSAQGTGSSSSSATPLSSSSSSYSASSAPPQLGAVLNVTVDSQYTAVQTAGVPPLLTLTSPQSLYNASTRYEYMAPAEQIDLPFPFYMYGDPYSTVWVASGGNIQFASAVQYAADDFLPINTYTFYSFLPVFEPFFADVQLVDNGNVTWSLETVAPDQRAVVIRYTDIGYMGDAFAGYDDVYSIDVLLYELPMGQIEVRYYRIDTDYLGQSVYQIGMQSGDGLIDAEGGGAGEGQHGDHGRFYSPYFILFDQLPIDATAQATLQNTTITWTFTGIESTNATCGGLGYDFSNISQSDLSYLVPADSTIYFLRVCGAVTQPDCVTGLAGENWQASMICQANTDTTGAVTGVQAALAVYNPNAVHWQFLPSGVQATIQDGFVCNSAAMQPRVSILNFLCDPTAIIANITGVLEHPTCTYTFNISTNIACGNGTRNNKLGAAASTLPSCQNITGVGYSAMWCPRALNTTAAIVPQPLPNLVIDTTLEYDDSYDNITIGFPVTLYGTNYSVLSIDNNGLLTFGPVGTSRYLPGPFPDLGFNGTADFFPLIAPLWVDTIDVAAYYATSDYNGFIGYSLEGTAPARRFFVRFSNVEYSAAQDSAVPGTCSFDVVLSENSTDIEVRYYYIAPNPSSFDALVVGMHGQNATVYTAVQNAPLLSVDVAARLSYSSIVYSYTGPTEAAVCGGGVFPQLASIPDLSLTFGTASYTLKPCGVTSTSSCVSSSLPTQAASVCLVQGANTFSLATDNPTATLWYVTSNTSARSVTQDGASSASCGGTPTVIVDYVCASNASTAVLSSVAVSGCTYSFVVNSDLLCSGSASSPPPPPSTSSSASLFSSSSSSATAAASGSSSSISSATAVVPVSSTSESPSSSSPNGATASGSSSTSASSVAVVSSSSSSTAAVFVSSSPSSASSSFAVTVTSAASAATSTTSTPVFVTSTTNGATAAGSSSSPVVVPPAPSSSSGVVISASSSGGQVTHINEASHACSAALVVVSVMAAVALLM